MLGMTEREHQVERIIELLQDDPEGLGAVVRLVRRLANDRLAEGSSSGVWATFRKIMSSH